MRSTLNAPGWWNRRSVLMLTLAVALVAVPVGARAGQETQAPAEEAQSAPETPAAPTMGFTADTGMVFYQITPSGTAAFEEVMAKVKEALAKSEDETRRKQAQSWRVFKADELMGDNVFYVFFVDPTIPGADYDFVKMLGEGFGDDPALIQDLYAKLKSAFAGGGNLLNLHLVADMGGM